MKGSAFRFAIYGQRKAAGICYTLVKNEDGDWMNQKKIGLFIAELRKKKGLTQEELGDRLGVTNKTVSRWETGKYMPDLSLIQSLCEELSISVNEFLSGEYLDDERFRKQADDNVMIVLNDKAALMKKKKISDFLTGAGTGLLMGTLYAPDTWRRITVIVVSIIMICAGQHIRSVLDKELFS